MYLTQEQAVKEIKRTGARSYAYWMEELTPCRLQINEHRKLAHFLSHTDLTDLFEIDYPLRAAYESFLNSHLKGEKQRYVKAMDRAKLLSLWKKEEKVKVLKKRVPYQNEKLYLPYFPVYEIAESFYYARKKEELLWDFSLSVPESLKRQIYTVLLYSLYESKNRHDRQLRFLAPLRCLYSYCIKNRVWDLEQLEEEDVAGIEEEIGKVYVEAKNLSQIVYIATRILFLEAKSTNWDANVWFLERFSIPEERMNPSNLIESFNFRPVKNKENRTLLKLYMKNQLGVGSLAISNIQDQFHKVRRFALFCDEKGMSFLFVKEEDVKVYIGCLEERDILAATFNKEILAVHQFFAFLKLKGFVKEIPFSLGLYLKNEIPVHHNRSVAREHVDTILDNLFQMPLHLRLMFLHLWALGLRSNEVCTIRAGAYKRKEDTYWLVLYQYKMHTEKSIPIPGILYELMVRYIQKKELKPGEYVFQNQRGGAYQTQTFREQMKEWVHAFGMDDYLFKSHDFRHTFASALWESKIPLPVIRDYLGHKDDDMTMQYLDYREEQVKKESTAYFLLPGKSLAARMDEDG